jgi:ribosomal protein S18 acetylase RimI-like enzyme
VQGKRQVMVVDDERPVIRADDGWKVMLIERGSPGTVREAFPLGAFVLYFEISDAALRRGEIANKSADQGVVFDSHKLRFGLNARDEGGSDRSDLRQFVDVLWSDLFPANNRTMIIRLLDASDAAEAADFLRLRLFGLIEAPSAFASNYQDEKDRTLEQVQAHLLGSSDTATFGGFEANELVGVVAVGRELRANERHMAFIRSMYVAPDARGKGLGRHLLDAALKHVSLWHGVEQVKLSVTAGNESAVHLYQSVGFVEVGRVPRALRIGSQYFDELIMLLVMG